MENAADALKMAAAVLIFVIAISTAMYGFTKARQTASAVISKSDNTRYYDSSNLDITDSRIVGIETVIPTLYSYFKEGYTVLFYTGSTDNKGNLVGDKITPMVLYYTEADDNHLERSRLRISNDSTKREGRQIYGLDLDDEAARHEVWFGSDEFCKNFVESLINRHQTRDIDYSRAPNSLVGTYNIHDTINNKFAIEFHYNFEGNNALSSMNTARFLERAGIYRADRIKTNNDINDIDTNINIDDSIIEFEGDVSVENGTGIQKRVIQYIYLTN